MSVAAFRFDNFQKVVKSCTRQNSGSGSGSGSSSSSSRGQWQGAVAVAVESVGAAPINTNEQTDN
ncbi:MAG TPA: hypothetical protein PK228_03355 [Saprospiraceae bacterium]|nr:hypothetical protein [Saprospiraceae bacterium]